MGFRPNLVTTVFSCFLLIAIVSGPLVAGIDLTPAERPSSGVSSTGQSERDVSVATAKGNISLARTTISDTTYQLEPGVSGSGIHKLQSPPVNITVDSISGTVFVAYTIRIPELRFMIETLQPVNQDSSHELTLLIDETTIASSRLKNSSYSGVAEISVRKNGTSRVVATQPITIEVS